MAMVDAADREYRSEKARFAETEASLRRMLKELKDDLEQERVERRSGAVNVRERESADARELGALRRRNEELTGEIEILKNSNVTLRKAQLQSKTDKSDWIEGEAAEIEKRLKAAEAQCKSLKGELQFEKSSVTKMESQALGLHKTIKDLNSAAAAKDSKIAQLQARIDELVDKLAKAEIEKNAYITGRVKQLEDASADIEARERELKDSLSKLKARETACANRETALTKSEASSARVPGKEVVTPGLTPGARASFAELARRYVFTPGMNAGADSPAASSKSPAPTRTPTSEKSNRLFAAVVERAQAVAKESGSKLGAISSAVSAKKTEVALKAFSVLSNAVGYKEEQPKSIAAPKRLEQTFTVASTAPEDSKLKAASVKQSSDKPSKSIEVSKSNPKEPSKKLRVKRSRAVEDEAKAEEAKPTTRVKSESTTTETKESEPTREARSSRTRKPTAKAAEAEKGLPASKKSVSETTEGLKRKRGRPPKNSALPLTHAELPSSPKPKTAELKDEQDDVQEPPRSPRISKSRTAAQLSDFLSPGKGEKASSRTSTRRSVRTQN